jgi:hypothetical protein
MNKQDDLIRRLNPGPPGDAPEPQSPFPVDPLGIPILDEVVIPGSAPETEVNDDERQAATVKPAEAAPPVHVPDYPRLIAELKSSLLVHLEQDLERLSGELTRHVIERLGAELEGEIRQRLHRLLEQRISALLDAELTRRSG